MRVEYYECDGCVYKGIWVDDKTHEEHKLPPTLIAHELEEQLKEIGKLKMKIGCHYCGSLLNATKPVGVYECPKCLKSFPNTHSVADIIGYLEQEHNPCNKTHCKICLFLKENIYGNG